MKEFIIYADESLPKGDYYSNFYGGVLIQSKHIEPIRNVLNAKKVDLNLYNEAKWSRVTATYLPKYIELVDSFFNFVAADQIKVRIMFTQNANVPPPLTAYQREHSYHMLYYQFLKHAFGLPYANKTQKPINLRIYLDRMPDTKEKNAQFKAYLQALQKASQFRSAQIQLREDQIAEVDSDKHTILQCLDIVLGAMQFRLNNKHLLKPENSHRRGKRTIAKEKLYKHILGRIRDIYPNFNIGISTGKSQPDDLWLHPYRHWLFVPSGSVRDVSKTKGK